MSARRAARAAVFVSLCACGGAIEPVPQDARDGGEVGDAPGADTGVDASHDAVLIDASPTCIMPYSEIAGRETEAGIVVVPDYACCPSAAAICKGGDVACACGEGTACRTSLDPEFPYVECR